VGLKLMRDTLEQGNMRHAVQQSLMFDVGSSGLYLASYTTRISIPEKLLHEMKHFIVGRNASRAMLSSKGYKRHHIPASMQPMRPVIHFYIRSTGVSPNNLMPLFSTIRAASYSAIRAFINSRSLPTIRKWS